MYRGRALLISLTRTQLFFIFFSDLQIIKVKQEYITLPIVVKLSSVLLSVTNDW